MDNDALDALTRAVDLAEPETLISPFLGAGTERLSGLLERLVLLRPALSDFARRLLELHAPRPGIPQQQVGPPELMTERERTVLRYLATMLSNAEIAEQMFLSPNTIKVHLRHVYRKLDVSSRRAAVRRARELQLLEDADGTCASQWADRSRDSSSDCEPTSTFLKMALRWLRTVLWLSPSWSAIPATRPPSANKLSVCHSRLVRFDSSGISASTGASVEGTGNATDRTSWAILANRPSRALSRSASGIFSWLSGRSVKAKRGASPIADRCARHHSHLPSARRTRSRTTALRPVAWT